MGNILSYCFPKSKRRSEGHKLGVRNDYDNNTTSNGGRTSGGGSRTSGGGSKTSGQSFSGQGRTMGITGVSGSNNEGGPSREEMAAAAQKRQESVSKIILIFVIDFE
jgi:hypothetical protein